MGQHLRCRKDHRYFIVPNDENGQPIITEKHHIVGLPLTKWRFPEKGVPQQLGGLEWTNPDLKWIRTGGTSAGTSISGNLHMGWVNIQAPDRFSLLLSELFFFTCNPIYFQCSVLLCCFVSGASSLWLSRSLVSTCVYMFLIFFGINLKFAVSVFPPRGLHFFACENHTV